MNAEHAVLATLLGGLTLYALLGGADFGAGVWELRAVLRRLRGDAERPAQARERALLYRAIGPVWEANHVWLIFVLVVLWTAFPPAFAGVCRALWIPLLLALAGIVLRGAAYAFRSYSPGTEERRTWETVFAVASTIAPFFLGCSAGAIASGQLAIGVDGSFAGDALTDWISPTAVFSGLLAVAACAHLAAVYLTREAVLADDVELTERSRRRALAVAIAMGALAGAGLLVVRVDAPDLWAGFAARGWPLVLMSVVGGVLSLFFLWRRSYGLAIAGAALAIGSVVCGWAAAQYPHVVPPALTLESASAPGFVLRPLLAITAAGAALLFPALGYLFWLFKSSPRGGAPRH